MARPKPKRKPMAEINVVPYIDVMLVLLIIFMVTAPLLMQGVKVDLPKVDTAPVDANDDPLIVSVKKDGSYFITLGEEHEKAVDLKEVGSKVQIVLRRKPQTSVLVWGDADVAYQKVIELMASLQEAGAVSVGLVTESPQ
jgi:biopolymer transport protein TolR